jgi:hypothetical protein
MTPLRKSFSPLRGRDRQDEGGM